MKKVTVLIPTLNSIQFMRECLESVVSQTLEDLEIIVIDAGSTDGTVELAESYRQQDERIRMVHSEKKSYGYQLNLGIRMAKGEYIGVVESDDIIEKDMYRRLFDVAKEKDADFVKGNFWHYAVTDHGQELLIPEANVSGDIIGKAVHPLEYREMYFADFYLWRGIYKRDFLRENAICFHESKGAAYQDIGFLFQIFTKAQRVVYLDECFYKYRRNNSASSTYSPKAFTYLAGEYAYILETLNAGQKIDSRWASVFYQKMFVQCRSRIRLLAFSGGDIRDVSEDILYLQRVLKDACESGALHVSAWSMALQIEFQMFLRDVYEYAAYYRTQMQAKRECVYHVLEELKGYAEVVLIGDTKAVPFLYTFLRERQLTSVRCIADNNPDKYGKKRMGLDIVSVEEVSKETKDRAYLVCSVRGLKALEGQLMSLGVQESQIYAYDMGVDWLLLA